MSKVDAALEMLVNASRKSPVLREAVATVETEINRLSREELAVENERMKKILSRMLLSVNEEETVWLEPDIDSGHWLRVAYFDSDIESDVPMDAEDLAILKSIIETDELL